MHVDVVVKFIITSSSTQPTKKQHGDKLAHMLELSTSGMSAKHQLMPISSELLAPIIYIYIYIYIYILYISM